MKTILRVKLLAVLGCLGLNALVAGQNLVPNPSFEDTIYCPTSFVDVGAVSSWRSCMASPDYYNVCAEEASGASTPHASFGYQVPSSGKGFTGMLLYYGGTGGYRELIGCTLTTPLVIGSKYYVSFRTSLADSSGVASNRLGVRFSNAYFFVTDTSAYTPPIDDNAHISVQSIISDTADWTLVSGKFQADSAYTQLIIGNFFQYSQMNLQVITNHNSYAYYYIDDVCVSLDSLECETLNDVAVRQPNYLTAFYDQNQHRVYLSTNSGFDIRCALTDILGRSATQSTLQNHAFLDVDNLSDGVYMLTARSGSASLTQKLLLVR
jgi:hypothetical protein